MKRFATIITIILLSAIVFVSCKKDYHCTCTFNGKVIYTTDINSKTHDDANDACSAHDSTVAGEVWNCGIY